MDKIEVVYSDLVLRMSEDGDGRTLEGYIVPWDKPALVSRPIPGWEIFKRGALTRSITESKHPIPLLNMHEEGEPVGKLHKSHDDETGQYGMFRLFDTPRAKEAAELVREGIWTGLSLGGFSVPARTTTRKGADGKTVIERRELRLDHVGLVRTPAFDEARVLALRSLEDATLVVAAAEARKRKRNRLVGS